jgi:cell division transport system permease protein
VTRGKGATLVNINTIRYLVEEGFAGMFKNKKTFAYSIGTIIAAMIFIGFFFILVENANFWIDGIKNDQGMEAFIKEGYTQEQITSIEGQIKAISSVKTIEYISKEQAFERDKERYEDQYEFLFEGREKIYPASFLITLNNLNEVKNVKEKLNDIKIDNTNAIEKVIYNGDTLSTLEKIARTVKVLSITFLIILSTMATFIIMNSVKLIMYARRKEISIMKYVGATDRFIKAPFIIEGIIVGVLGGLITLVIIQLVYGGLTKQASKMIVQFSEIRTTLFWIFMALGIGIGTIGSSISIKKYLDV